MAKQYRKKPLASFEHGTRIYAPTDGERHYRVVATDPGTGERVYAKLRHEEAARDKARELEDRLVHAVKLRLVDDGVRTVGMLAQQYLDNHIAQRSTRYQERQEYLLRRWVRPVLADTAVKDWTPAASEEVLNRVRQAKAAASTVQSVGATMRGLVTYARKLRWLTGRDEDPMWMVSYSAQATVQSPRGRAIAPTRTAIGIAALCVATAVEPQGVAHATAMSISVFRGPGHHATPTSRDRGLTACGSPRWRPQPGDRVDEVAGR